MNSDSIPDAPWELQGEAIVTWASLFTLRQFVSYTASPVGPYQEYALMDFTRRGPHVSRMSVNSPASQQAGNEIWGYPKTLEELGWNRRGDNIEFRRGAHRVSIRVFGPSLPLYLPFWTAQQRDAVWVKVPAFLRGKVRLCRVGRRYGLALEQMQLKIEVPQPFLV